MRLAHITRNVFVSVIIYIVILWKETDAHGVMVGVTRRK